MIRKVLLNFKPVMIIGYFVIAKLKDRHFAWFLEKILEIPGKISPFKEKFFKTRVIFHDTNSPVSEAFEINMTLGKSSSKKCLLCEGDNSRTLLTMHVI